MNTKGLIQIFKVKLQQCLDSCALEQSISVAELVKSQDCLLDQVTLLQDESVVVTLENGTKYIFDQAAKCFRQLQSEMQLQTS